MSDVVMPRLSDSMEEGTIVRWLKADGDEVRRGEEIAEIETDKATMTYEADQDGVLSIVASEGDTLPIGEVIARIGAEGEDGGCGFGAGCRRTAPEAESGRKAARGIGPKAVGGSARARGRGRSGRRSPSPSGSRARPLGEQWRASGSRPRRWPGGWPGTWAWSSAR